MKRESLLVLMMGTFALASPAFAETRCSTADYYGTYGFYSTGALLKLPPEGCGAAWLVHAIGDHGNILTLMVT